MRFSAPAAAGTAGRGLSPADKAHYPAATIRGGHVNKSAITPMMAQYLEIKAEYPDALLFYRMGDFYELFFDDAVAAAEALDIALTKRGRHLGQDIPMCGVPERAADNYLLTLIRKGFRVAVCEQMEDPKQARKRGSKAVVRREVVRLVTPGTLTEDSLLDARRHNFLAAYCEIRGQGALAWTDISTGDLTVSPCSRVRLGPELARLLPREMLVPQPLETELADLGERTRLALTPLAPASFDSTAAGQRLHEIFAVASLDAFGGFSRAETGALGALISYLELTQKGRLPRLRPPRREQTAAHMQIDAATRANLELTESLSAGPEGSLLAAVDRTLTASGGRLLARRISSPSRELDTILPRLETVSWLVGEAEIRDRLREALRRMPDMERALSRLALGRGGPRDLGALRAGLDVATGIGVLLQGKAMPTLLEGGLEDLGGFEALLGLLDSALARELPLLVRDGGFIAPGFDAELDRARELRDEGRGVIAGMQADYARLAGIASLKIRHNNVLGYFIETTALHADKMLSAPLSETFRHRQTTANALRFTTVELSELETRILNAGARALELEKAGFERLRQAALERAEAIGRAADMLAEIDLAAGLASLAAEEDWCRPVVDDSRAFEIEEGRHPVVEAALKPQGTAFIANDCALNAADGQAAIWLLTGPNMAGKSTFLRQNALIAILAQMGSFVPAKKARIGLVSQLFSRVGASDDLARGRSTFMVEMVETAAILNQADDRALVILDEIGRGTATWDGLSIAWATLEHLQAVNRCRTLFATHYHELTQLADTLDGVGNATIAVKEWRGEVIFLHEVRQGAADRSYGVQVARLAGLPHSVVERARVVLAALEKGERERGSHKALIDDLPLFAAIQGAAGPEPARSAALEQRLAEIRPDDLTPRAALDLIYELKALAETP